MNHLDLFSGIGAFTLAAQRNGINTIYLSEINDQANKVLSKNFPSIPNLGDVRDIDGEWMCLPWKGGVSLERLGSCVVESAEANPTGIREGDGVSRGMDGHRYLMPGNSIAPKIPTIIFEKILLVDAAR